MPFVTQGKANLKYILIVVILAAIVGGGILGYQYWLSPEEPSTTTLPGSTGETFCNIDNDCVVTSYTYDCCGAPCGGAIINRQTFEKRKQWTIDNCTPLGYEKCPSVDCELVEEKAVCENNKCVRKEGVLGKFDSAKIEAVFTFYDSKGATKKIVVYNTWAEDFNKVFYLTDEDLNKDSAVKIIDLVLQDILSFPNVSPGEGVKYIVVELVGEPMNDMVIIDETGKVIVPSVYAKNPQLIEEIKKMEIGWGQHGISFQEWVDSKTFIMNVALANGSLYKVNVDVTTGEAVGKPQKVE